MGLSPCHNSYRGELSKPMLTNYNAYAECLTGLGINIHWRNTARNLFTQLSNTRSLKLIALLVNPEIVCPCHGLNLRSYIFASAKASLLLKNGPVASPSGKQPGKQGRQYQPISALVFGSSPSKSPLFQNTSKLPTLPRKLW